MAAIPIIVLASTEPIARRILPIHGHKIPARYGLADLCEVAPHSPQYKITLTQPPAHNTRHLQHGFTMVELITVMVITGVLAAMVAPRFFDTNVFESRGFYDQVISTLRYAQKAAIAQNQFVCVAFTANSIALTYGTTNTCGGGNLTSPTGGTPYTVTAPSSNVTLSGYTTPFSFDKLGRPSVAQSITVNGYATAPITVEAETGYVH